jgi:hypothetical protein
MMATNIVPELRAGNKPDTSGVVRRAAYFLSEYSGHGNMRRCTASRAIHQEIIYDAHTSTPVSVDGL